MAPSSISRVCGCSALSPEHGCRASLPGGDLTRLRVRPDAIVVRQLDTMTGWAVSPGPGEVSTAVFAQGLAGRLAGEGVLPGREGGQEGCESIRVLSGWAVRPRFRGL